MLINYLFQNFGFALSVFSALVFFATGWLYLNSWKIATQTKGDLIRSLGFFLLALFAIIEASSLNLPALNLFSQIVKIVALLGIAGSLAVEPMVKIPKKEVVAISPLFFLTNSLIPLSAVLLFLIAFLYFRKSTVGGFKQIKPAAFAFLVLALAELVSLLFFWQETTNPFWSQILALYGPVWIIAHLIELAGLIILAKWVWGYFRFQIRTQFFLITISASIGFFVVTTACFTFLLLYNFEKDALSHLKTDIRVVQYAMERLQAETLACATAVAENTEVKNAFISKNKNELYRLTSSLMLSHNTSFLTVTDNTGKVMMRGEDKNKVGDTLIFDPTIKSALEGQRLATVISQEGAIAPHIQIKASVPFYIYKNSKTQGVISTGFWIDSAFVDGIKSVTGLDVTVFGGNKRAATTFVASDGKTRLIGSLETNPAILETVLEKGEIFVGAANILNKPYYTAYAPLITYPDKTIGMLFVGKLQTELFETAQKSIQLTFIGSIFLMTLSLIPAYYLSRYIEENLKA